MQQGKQALEAKVGALQSNVVDVKMKKVNTWGNNAQPESQDLIARVTAMLAHNYNPVNYERHYHRAGTQKRQTNHQQGESNWRNKEGIKRSQRDILFVSYEEQEDDLYDLDHPKRSRYGVNRLLGQC